MIMRLTLHSLSVLILSFLAGCGADNGLHSVTGSVSVKDQPAAGALVRFVPDGPPDLKAIPATGVTGADGTFTMSTGTNSGVKPGKYSVTVVWPDPSVKLTEAQKMAGANPYDAPDVLKDRYKTPEKSKLKVEIKAGHNKLEPFALK
jgi:hypothetical protein